MDSLQRDRSKVNDGRQLLRLRSGTVVGHIEGDSAVFSVGERHYFRKVGGYSIDADLAFKLLEDGTRFIVFAHGEQRWRISVDRFWELAQRLDFGWGEKLVAPSSAYEEISEQPGLPGFGEVPGAGMGHASAA